MEKEKIAPDNVESRRSPGDWNVSALRCISVVEVLCIGYLTLLCIFFSLYCFLHFVSKDDGHFVQAFHVVGSCLPTIIIK